MSEKTEQLALPFIEAARNDTPVDTEAPSSITREAINELPIRSYQGQVILVTSDDELAPAIEEIRKETLLGFDTETKPVFRPGVSHPPALVQLAGESCAWIFQLRNLKKLNLLYSLFANARILKAGVALADDLKKLKELHDFKPAGFTEVGDLARKLGYTQTGLRTLAGLVLGFRVSKREQRSNWARTQLTTSQITYAATDAWVSRELYLGLTRRLEARG